MSYWDGTRWIADPPATSKPRPHRRFFGAAAEATLVTALIFGLIAGTTLAAKGGNRDGARGGADKGSLVLVMVDDTNANGLPNHADTITFDVSTASTDKPYVNVRCYQSGSFVYDGWVGYFPGSWFAQSFLLDSTYWNGGAADCTARLVMFGSNGRERTLAELPFAVGA